MFAREWSRIKFEFEKEHRAKFYKQAFTEHAERHKREWEQVMQAAAKRAIIVKQCFMCGEYGHFKSIVVYNGLQWFTMVYSGLQRYRIFCLKCRVSGHYSEVCNILTEACKI